MASKIDEYGLHEIAKELRESGKPIKTISNILNEQYLPPDVEKISDMAVSRWIRANHVVMRNESESTNGKIVRTLPEDQLPSFNNGGVSAAEDVNPYEEAILLVEDCDLQIESIKKQVERLNNINAESKYTIDMNNLLQRYIAQKQSLLSDISKYQIQMSTYGNVKQTITILFKTLQEVSPEAYEVFKKRIAEQQAIRTIIK